MRSLLSDSVNLNLGQLLAMSVALLEALAADLLEDKDLVGLGIVIQNSGLDHRTFYVRSTDLDTRVTSDEEYLVELYISTIRSREAVYEDLIASLYLELLACNFNDCVHNKLYQKVSTVSVRSQNGSFSVA
jgi:hypothetical protein